jgi:hypothetical protein
LKKLEELIRNKHKFLEYFLTLELVDHGQKPLRTPKLVKFRALEPIFQKLYI